MQEVYKVQWKLPAGWSKQVGRYKYLLLAALVGIVLLLPTGTAGQKQEEGVDRNRETYDLERMERKLETVLSKINGAGKVTVVLTLKDDGKYVYAQDINTDQREQSRKTVLVGQGGGGEQPIPVQRFSPVFQGALAVCPGGGDPGVRLQLTGAICALTGLSTERITICQSES